MAVDQNRAKLNRMRSDSSDDDATLVSYNTPGGDAKVLQGDEAGPYVRLAKGKNEPVESGSVSDIAESDALLGVHDPTLGATTDAAITDGSAGTLAALIRGLNTLIQNVSRRLGPQNSQTSNQAVTSSTAVVFTVTAGTFVRVACTEEMTFLFGSTAPTTTTGNILAADSSEDFEVPAGVTQLQVIATDTAGRVSVGVVSPT